MRATLNNLTFNRNGLQLVTLAVEGDFRERYDALAGKELDVEIKQHRNRRSLDQNAYLHVLINKIAAAVGASEEDIKSQLVLDYGVIDEEDGNPVGFKLLSTIDVSRVCKYARLHKQTVENGKVFNCWLVYKETHRMNTEEMTRLIDGAISEAKELGIETATPAELARLKEEWARHDQQHHAG